MLPFVIGIRQRDLSAILLLQLLWIGLAGGAI